MTTQRDVTRKEDVVKIDGLTVRYVDCPYCQSPIKKTIFTRHSYAFVRCLNCQLVRVNPQLTADSIVQIYSKGYQQKSTIKQNKILKPSASERYVLDYLASKSLTKGKLLDVGCFQGDFLRKARHLGWSVTGTEISEQAADYAQSEWNLDIHVGALANLGLPSSHFDAIVLRDVIEHLPDPLQTLTEIYRLLKPGGVLYIWTPNFDSFTRFFTGARWGAVIFPWHLVYFSVPTLKKSVEKVGLITEKVLTRNLLLNFRDPYESFLHSNEKSGGSIWSSRIKAGLDMVTLPAFRILDSIGRYHGAQIELFAVKLKI